MLIKFMSSPLTKGPPLPGDADAVRPGALGEEPRVPEDDDPGVRGPLHDRVQHALQAAAQRPEPLGDVVALVLAAGGERQPDHAAREHVREAAVVAADADRHQAGAGAQPVDLRRLPPLTVQYFVGGRPRTGPEPGALGE